MLSFKGYLTEASLSGNSTNGTPNVLKYVVNNPKAMEIEYEIERGKNKVPVYDNDGNLLRVIHDGVGQKFKLKSKKLIDIESKPALDTELGVIPARFIRKPSGFKAMDAEILATNSLDEEIKKAVRENNGKGIAVKIGKFTVKDVVSAGSDHIKGDPKADIALMDSRGKEVGFISHKKEGGAKGFSQFGGISIKSGLKHREIDSFVEDLAKRYEGGSVSRGDALYRPLKDPKLINASIYGPDYGGPFGRENCHCIGQGNPILTKEGNSWKLDFSESMHVNGDYRFATRGKFLAVFGATYRANRRVVTAGGDEVRNVRAGIYPIAYMETRKKLEKI